MVHLFSQVQNISNATTYDPSVKLQSYIEEEDKRRAEEKEPEWRNVNDVKGNLLKESAKIQLNQSESYCITSSCVVVSVFNGEAKKA